ncbi:hypothetical protein RESH_01576 [Rhodopirellula europaea SH398]|uniref:Uncharacterized protein n=1 Tax=Rhodopirellula europaea SH398 TaxID=1263868 RepID=M5SJI8_9BACT|nr:hypothetical protein RESH_01576 [Rhodopirellula europaea SH398]
MELPAKNGTGSNLNICSAHKSLSSSSEIRSRDDRDRNHFTKKTSHVCFK